MKALFVAVGVADLVVLTFPLYVDLMARRLIPHWLYRFLGDRGWKKQARKYGVLDKLWDRPFS